MFPFWSRTDQSTSASPCPAPGERRTLLLPLLLLFSLILVPRIPRLETYLLVTSKRSVTLAPAGQAWRQSSEQTMEHIEAALRAPSQHLDQAATRMAEAITSGESFGARGSGSPVSRVE